MVCSAAINASSTAPKCHPALSESNLASSLTYRQAMKHARTQSRAPSTEKPYRYCYCPPQALPRRPGPAAGAHRPRQHGSMLLSAAVSHSPPSCRRAFLLLPLSRALLFVRHGLNIGLPWPVLPAKPCDVLIPAAVSAPYLISVPTSDHRLPATGFYTQPNQTARFSSAPHKHPHPPGNSVTTRSFFIWEVSCI